MRSDEMGGRIGRASLGVFARTQRRADRKAAQRLHAIAANSTEVATRVRDWWHRDSTVIAPPVDTDFFTAFDAPSDRNNRDDFFLLAGRLVPYKHPEIAVAAAQRAGVRLVVAGDGRARAACEAYAGKYTEFVGAVSDEQLRDYYRRCRALIYPGREDFGIMPVEAQSCGAPVIAVGVGGVLDTVVDGTTGILYPEGPSEVAALADVLRNFDGNRFDPMVISDQAARFHPSHFRHTFRAFVEQSL